MKQEIENMLDKHQPDWRKSCQRWEEEYVHALSSSVKKKSNRYLTDHPKINPEYRKGLKEANFFLTD